MTRNEHVNWIWTEARQGEVVVPSVLRCLACVALMKIHLGLRGLGGTLRWIRAKIDNVPIAITVSDTTVAALEYAVAMAAAFYPGRAQCLERSLALFYLGRRAGIPVTYHHGVQPVPFAAHAWVEYRGRAINDVQEHVDYFQRFPQVCP